jgi:signal transduction histidine kinase/ligand-binding sensor domain-containing protein
MPRGQCGAGAAVCAVCIAFVCSVIFSQVFFIPPLFTQPLFAQSFGAQPLFAQRPLKFERVGFEQGLSHGAVHAIVQDSIGFLWFGTEDGLCRYDGLSMKVYLPLPGDTNSVAHENVRALYVDKAVVLWVGTHDGLCRYNARTDNFTRFRHDGHNAASISADNITAFHEDAAGTLWIATYGGGLNALDRARRVFRRFQHEPHRQQSIHSDYLWTICEDRTGKLWLGSQDNGVCRFDKTTGACVCYPSKPSDSSALGSPTVWAIYEDRAGAIWVGAWGSGLHKFNAATNKWTRFSHHTDSPTKLSEHTIVDIHEDAAGTLWLATRGGLIKFCPQTKTFQRFQSNPLDPSTLSNDIVWSIFADRTGTLWFGTENGISKHSPYNQRFQTLRHVPQSQQSLSSNNVHTVYEDAEGIVWVGTWGGGLNRVNPRTGAFTVFTNEPNNDNSLSQNAIWALAGGGKHELWVGTTMGLNRLQTAQNRWTRYFYNPNDSNSLSFDYIKSLCVSSDGAVWAGTTKKGLNRFDPHGNSSNGGKANNGVWTHYGYDAQNPHSISSDNITAIVQSRTTGMMWVGTFGAGLNRFAPSTPSTPSTLSTPPHSQTASPDGHIQGEWTRFASSNSNVHSLSDSVVTALWEDSAGVLWVGTMRGLCSIDQRTSVVQRHTARMRLACERICGIVGDAHGMLWISTFKGLVRYNPRTEAVQRFGLEDGLQDNKFNNRSCWQFRNGYMAFGGVNGLSMFHPDSIRLNIHPPPVVITSFKKLNRAVRLDSNITLLRTLHLAHDDYAFSLEFAALEFADPAHNSYAYMLEGFDKDWVQSGSQHSAQYTNLAPGHYTFRVKACNNDGIWNERGATLDIIVWPPWWRTWWAFGLYALLLAFVLERVMWWREQRQRRAFWYEQQEREAAIIKEKNAELARANEELQRLNAEKNEILGIAAHDMKNPLSAIMMYAELIHETTHEIEGAASNHEPVKRIQDSTNGVVNVAHRMFDMVKNLLDMNALEEGRIRLDIVKIDIVELCATVLSLHKQRAFQKGITLHWQIPQDKRVYALADYRALMHCVDNLLSNALKYSPSNTNVYVTAQAPNHSHSNVRLTVQDEGPGLTAADQEQLFQKFVRLSARPTGGESSTGLGLSIVKKFVESMNGRVYCDSAPEQGKRGATFVIELPSAPAPQEGTEPAMTVGSNGGASEYVKNLSV